MQKFFDYLASERYHHSSSILLFVWCLSKKVWSAFCCLLLTKVEFPLNIGWCRTCSCFTSINIPTRDFYVMYEDHHNSNIAKSNDRKSNDHKVWWSSQCQHTCTRHPPGSSGCSYREPSRTPPSLQMSRFYDRLKSNNDIHDDIFNIVTNALIPNLFLTIQIS